MSSGRRDLEKLVDVVSLANTDSKQHNALFLERSGSSAYTVLRTTIRHHNHHLLSTTAPPPKQSPLGIRHGPASFSTSSRVSDFVDSSQNIARCTVSI